MSRFAALQTNSPILWPSRVEFVHFHADYSKILHYPEGGKEKVIPNNAAVVK